MDYKTRRTDSMNNYITVEKQLPCGVTIKADVGKNLMAFGLVRVNLTDPVHGMNKSFFYNPITDTLQLWIYRENLPVIRQILDELTMPEKKLSLWERFKKLF